MKVCILCKQPNESEYRRCQTCLMKQREWDKRHRETKREQYNERKREEAKKRRDVINREQEEDDAKNDRGYR